MEGKSEISALRGLNTQMWLARAEYGAWKREMTAISRDTDLMEGGWEGGTLGLNPPCDMCLSAHTKAPDPYAWMGNYILEGWEKLDI